MIAVIDYGVGNLFSVGKALASVGAEVEITHDIKTISKAEKLLLPGVGAFGDCMKSLGQTGLIPEILHEVKAGKPLLGICVGLQILFEGSDESPGIPGLSLLPGMVRRIEAPKLKIPHMGWNSLLVSEPRQEKDMFRDLPNAPYVYFVHSYQACPRTEQLVTAWTTYGSLVTAAVAKDNIQAVQFHPEKSGEVGLTVLKNFVES